MPAGGLAAVWTGMSVELAAAGLWTAVTLLAVASAVYLLVMLAPDRARG